MVLDDVPHSADLFVESSSPLHAEIFGHGDLDALDVRAIPEGFKHLIGEAEKEHAVHGLLAKIMIDAENALFVEGLEEDVVQLTGRRQIAAKWLFDNDSSV